MFYKLYTQLPTGFTAISLVQLALCPVTDEAFVAHIWSTKTHTNPQYFVPKSLIIDSFENLSLNEKLNLENEIYTKYAKNGAVVC